MVEQNKVHIFSDNVDKVIDLFKLTITATLYLVALPFTKNIPEYNKSKSVSSNFKVFRILNIRKITIYT